MFRLLNAKIDTTEADDTVSYRSQLSSSGATIAWVHKSWTHAKKSSNAGPLEETTKSESKNREPKPKKKSKLCSNKRKDFLAFLNEFFLEQCCSIRSVYDLFFPTSKIKKALKRRKNAKKFLWTKLSFY